MKKKFFPNFILTSARKVSPLKQFTFTFTFTSERSHYALWEKGIIHYAMISCFEDIRVWSRRVLLEFCRVSIFFDILIANISWTVTQTPINHVIFWKSIMRTFRCIYVNCSIRLRFLDEISTKLSTLLGNLRTITQKGNMETRQMTSFFHLFFPL